ncbi:MAG: hypothetical protein PHI31_03275 [Desulfuromonadaceae bacterium]|nr:hypothetical protein [Desulfuromonadaceae bacterium]
MDKVMSFQCLLPVELRIPARTPSPAGDEEMVQKKPGADIFWIFRRPGCLLETL